MNRPPGLSWNLLSKGGALATAQTHPLGVSIMGFETSSIISVE